LLHLARDRGGSGTMGVGEKIWALRQGRAASVLLKALSVSAGVFLLVAGTIGLSALVFGQFVYFIGSLYTIVFGVVVTSVEVRDKVPMLSIVYQWIDTYLKFMTLQRGKGLFYWGVGLLVLFIGPDSNSWGLNNVAAIFLAVVGILHAFKIIKEDSHALGPGDPGMFDQPLPTPAASQWTDLVNSGR